MKTRYCVLYPEAENVHLIKDVGMIAYKMFKLFGYEASLACYDNVSYDYLDKEVKGLKLNFIEKKYHNSILDGIRYLKKNAKSIDVLQLFHITIRSVFYTFAYKLFNSKGKIFLKLDCTERLIDVIKGLSNIKLKLLNMFLDKIDVIGIEQKRLYEELKQIIQIQKEKLLLTPNGIDFQSSDKYENIDYNHKENVILHVGRIGSPEKATEVLINAIAKIEDIENSGWKAYFIGPIENSFKMYLNEFFGKHEKLKDIILFKGAISDREQLYEEYRKSKIFCLSSNYESFGIALLEAAAFGDVIVSTDVGIAKEIVGFENGAIVEIGDSETLSKKLRELMSFESLEDISKATETLCREKFDWNNIVQLLHEALMKINRG
jgi:L-malate glycosyltransferase